MAYNEPPIHQEGPPIMFNEFIAVFEPVTVFFQNVKETLITMFEVGFNYVPNEMDGSEAAIEFAKSKGYINV